MTMDPALTAVAISIRKAWRKLAPIRLFLVWNVLHLMLPWPDQRNHRANSVVCGKASLRQRDPTSLACSSRALFCCTAHGMG